MSNASRLMEILEEVKTNEQQQQKTIEDQNYSNRNEDDFSKLVRTEYNNGIASFKVPSIETSRFETQKEKKEIDKIDWNTKQLKVVWQLQSIE